MAGDCCVLHVFRIAFNALQFIAGLLRSLLRSLLQTLLQIAQWYLTYMHPDGKVTWRLFIRLSSTRHKSRLSEWSCVERI